MDVIKWSCRAIWAEIIRVILKSNERTWNTHMEKYRFFFRVFDIANQLQLLARHSPFAPLGQPSLYSIQGRLSEFFRIIAAKTLKIRIAYRQ